MENEISPEVKRIIIRYAAMENVTYTVALECLIIEGIKSICEKVDGTCPVVNKACINTL